MKDEKNNKKRETRNLETPQTSQTSQTPQTPQTPQPSQTPEPAEQTAQPDYEAEIADLKDKNLRLVAEFENFRRRTNKEKLDLLETAGERIFTDMLPLVDDFERAAEHGDLSEGGQLIYKKFQAFLDAQHVTVIPTEGVDFNTDEHEAITTIAAGEDKRGKIIDCTQRGYKLGGKVIRFAKVVVGE